MHEALRMSEAEVWSLFERIGVAHLSAVDPSGRPLCRVLHPIVHERRLCFHGSARGEKQALLGARVLVSAHEVVARIPSWFRDPELACPATTFYRSVEARGVVTEVTEPAEKAAILAALMSRYQPEGRYRPLSADDPAYRARIKGVQVLALVPTELVGKAALGQNKSERDQVAILEGLWERGDPGDVEALEAVASANGRPLPAGPHGTALVSTWTEQRAEQVLALVRDAYWNAGRSDEEILGAHRCASAWVGALDNTGRVVATARAVSDTRKHAWLGDVVTSAEWRGRGVGTAVLSRLLDHPRVRHVRTVQLQTRDAMRFYEGLGFHVTGGVGDRTQMSLVRTGGAKSPKAPSTTSDTVVGGRACAQCVVEQHPLSTDSSRR